MINLCDIPPSVTNRLENAEKFGRIRHGWLLSGTGTPEGLPRFFKGPKTPQLKRSLVNSEVNSLLRAKLKG